MIAFIRGAVHRIAEESILLDTGSIGYELFVPAGLLLQLEEDEEVFLWTYQQIKEDSHILYGFAQETELKLFRKLITVSGVGPRLALAMLSAKSTREIVLAIAQERSDVLSEISGIGAKTAKRMILELKDKMVGYLEEMDPILVDSMSYNPSNIQELTTDQVAEAISGMQNLGYSKREIERLIYHLAQLNAKADAGTLITLALKELGR